MMITCACVSEHVGTCSMHIFSAENMLSLFGKGIYFKCEGVEITLWYSFLPITGRTHYSQNTEMLDELLRIFSEISRCYCGGVTLFSLQIPYKID